MALVPAFAPTSLLSQPAEPPREGRTFHVAPGGDDRASGFRDAPWATLRHAWSALQPGDVVVVADGSYGNGSPPPGLAGQPGREIVVRAATPGRARLDTIVFRGNSHLALEGFRIAGAERAVAILSQGKDRPSHHLALRQIGFSCTPGTLNDGACFALGDGTHHVLLEDSWGWGGGRYTILCYGGPGGKPANLTCDHNTFRRVVLRMGPARSSPGNPQASLALYYASQNVVENVIAIDGKAASDSSNAAFYVTGHEVPPVSNGNRFIGVVALGNQGAGFYQDCPGAVCDGTVVRDSVFWGATGLGLGFTGGRKGGDSCQAPIAERNTVGGTVKGHGFVNYACEAASLVGNALIGNEGFGSRQASSAGTTPTAHHNGYFGNRAGARQGIASGTGDVASDPKLRHLLRVDPASPWRNAGAGGDIGANVTHRSVDGKPTTQALWPWPNEARLRTEMCDPPVGAFCASGKSLTRYLWEYLGSPIPPEIER